MTQWSKGLFGIGLTVAAIAIGCGGAVEPGGGGGAQGSGGSAGGSGSGGGGGGGGGAGGSGANGGSGGTAGAPALDAGPGVCPDSAPTPGSMCVEYLGPYCEYGSSPNPDCNNAFTCTSGVWEKAPSTGACPAPGASCPSSYPGVDSMDPACSVDGLSCEFPQGFCVCSSDPGGLPTTGGPVWSCRSPGKDCPAKRPLLGSSCSGPGDSNEQGPVCDYGSCSGGVSEQCTGWYWKLVETACPV
jgi:hypothetical protein